MDRSSSSLVALRAPRRVEQIVVGQATQDGAGVKLTRVLAGPALQRRLDPFLMLDAFGSDRPGDYIAGFPDHPHRGFETVTYMLAGRMRHRDSAGHEGLLTAGGVQWMTAGRGVIHSELPEQEHGLMAGFQLWLNLPARDKLCAPWYRDFPAELIPVWQGDGVTVHVIAGHCGAGDGALAGAVDRVTQREATQPLYLDVHLAAGATFAQPLPASRNAFVYVYDGEVAVAGQAVPAQRMAVLANDPEHDGVLLQAGAAPARALLVAGQPLGEPIAQYGPFVMNTQSELRQAVRDFQEGRLA